ncbi:MAG: N-acetyl-gamma-glutamyl-phosphate reductase [Planctomycetota bacterium]
MIRVGIVGASGYTALELIKLLLRHPQAEITRLTSRDESSPHLSAVHPSLRDRLDLHMSLFDVETFCADVDFAFSCLPHAASAEVVSQLCERGIRTVDFSADYRLDNVELFETVYGTRHPDPERVGSVAYGIPELFRDAIRKAHVVANPGCFPSSALLPLAPLMKAGMLCPAPVIVDSKTGISGAGRKSSLKFHFPECNESVAAYGVGTHRHMPEIDNLISRYSNVDCNVVFTPHLIPMDRGIHSTIYAQPARGTTVESLASELRQFYSDEPFIRITDQPPLTRNVSGTNYCDICVQSSRDQIVILSAIDNLIKGASGAAVQNFNVMNGFEETTALL